jgi:hypothetical protein
LRQLTKRICERFVKVFNSSVEKRVEKELLEIKSPVNAGKNPLCTNSVHRRPTPNKKSEQKNFARQT